MKKNQNGGRNTGQLWYCTRQRAGPLVKECRALRPRFSPLDDQYTRSEKADFKRRYRSAVCQTPVDRLELRLGLFGFEGTHYELSFDDEHLPRTFKGVRRVLSNLLKRCKRWRNGRPFDYVYAIEYGTQHCRYHVHLVLRDSEFSPAEVRYLWRQGDVQDFPVLLKHGGYRRLAKYFNKEPSDGYFLPVGRHKWSCSRTLTAKLPEPETWEDSSGVIRYPRHILWASSLDGPQNFNNEFGSYYYYSWIEPKKNGALYLE